MLQSFDASCWGGKAPTLFTREREGSCVYVCVSLSCVSMIGAHLIALRGPWARVIVCECTITCKPFFVAELSR